eukprot:3185398-Pyramimonas_sp.AAC.1
MCPVDGSLAQTVRPKYRKSDPVKSHMAALVMIAATGIRAQQHAEVRFLPLPLPQPPCPLLAWRAYYGANSGWRETGHGGSSTGWRMLRMRPCG